MESELLLSQGKYILVVDDDSDARLTIAEYLQAKNFSVQTANDGLEALTAFEERVFDLIVLDAQMPQIDGFGSGNSMSLGDSTWFAGLAIEY